MESEVVVAKSGVQLVGGARQGKLWMHGTGSYLMLGANLQAQGTGHGAMLRFAKISSPTNPNDSFYTMGCGVSGLSFVNERIDHDDRRWTCEAAVHVHGSDAFTLENCTFEAIVGRALRLTRSVQSHFTNVRVMRCGAESRPAVHLDGPFKGPAGTWVVQGSTFTGFRVEGCFDAPYFEIASSGIEGGDNSANKFDDIGFEGYERGQDPHWADTAQTFLSVGAHRNQFGKIHFWRVGGMCGTPKLMVTAEQCEFGELLFGGVKGPGGSFELAGSSNTVGSVVVRAATNDPHSLGIVGNVETEIRISGHGNHVGRVVCGMPDAVSASAPTIARIDVTGDGNVVGSVLASRQHGVWISGADNKLLSYTSRSAPTTALRVTGPRADVGHALIEACAVDAGPVVEVGDPLDPGRDWRNRSRLCVQVYDAPNASEGILVDSSEVQLLPGTRVESIPRGHGLRWCGQRGGWRGLDVEQVGKDGIFVDGGTPVSMHDWTVRRCNQWSGLEKPHWGGFHATPPAYAAERASCTGFAIREDGSTHAYSFKIGAAGTTGAKHQHWQIRGNVSGGGPVEIPSSVQHSVDFDSDGQGDNVSSSSTIAMPDTADFVVVTGTTDIETLKASWKGRRGTLRFAASLTVNNGTGNLELAGGVDFSATANDVLTLICDGSSWYEVSRSLN